MTPTLTPPQIASDVVEVLVPADNWNGVIAMYQGLSNVIPTFPDKHTAVFTLTDYELRITSEATTALKAADKYSYGLYLAATVPDDVTKIYNSLINLPGKPTSFTAPQAVTVIAYKGALPAVPYILGSVTFRYKAPHLLAKSELVMGVIHNPNFPLATSAEADISVVSVSAFAVLHNPNFELRQDSVD